MGIHGCPYRASNNKVCTHKGMPINRKHKTICPYNSEKKCEMYNEWLELKSACGGTLEAEINYIEQEGEV